MFAKVFKSGNSMAVRIPKSVDLSHISEFSIEKRGQKLILTPSKNKKSWDSFFKAIDEFRGKIEIPNDELPQERF